MTRLCFALFVLSVSAATAVAQPVPPGGGAASRPTVSPYLGLLGGGRNPGLNYLAFVRPQLQMQQQFNQLQQQQQQYNNGLQQELNGLSLGGDPFLPQTGVVARFNSLGSYYGRHPVAGAGNLRGFGSGGGGGSSFGGGRSFGAAGLGGSSFGGASGFSGARSTGRAGGIPPRATGAAGVGGVRR